MSDEEIRKKYIELQLYQTELKEIRDKLENIDIQITEINAVKQSLDEIKTLDDGSEMLVPIANGIFATAKLQKQNKLKVNIGSNTVRDYTFDEANELLDRQSKDIAGIRNHMIDQFEGLAGQMQVLEEELLKLSQKAQNQ